MNPQALQTTTVILATEKKPPRPGKVRGAYPPPAATSVVEKRSAELHSGHILFIFVPNRYQLMNCQSGIHLSEIGLSLP
jgi:hypothetical protein